MQHMKNYTSVVRPWMLILMERAWAPWHPWEALGPSRMMATSCKRTQPFNCPIFLSSLGKPDSLHWCLPSTVGDREPGLFGLMKAGWAQPDISRWWPLRGSFGPYLLGFSVALVMSQSWLSHYMIKTLKVTMGRMRRLKRSHHTWFYATELRLKYWDKFKILVSWNLDQP